MRAENTSPGRREVVPAFTRIFKRESGDMKKECVGKK